MITINSTTFGNINVGFFVGQSNIATCLQSLIDYYLVRRRAYSNIGNTYAAVNSFALSRAYI